MLCDAENLYNVSDSNLGNILSYETGLYRSGKHGETVKHSSSSSKHINLDGCPGTSV